MTKLSLPPKPGEDLDLDEMVRFRCPCGKSASAGIDKLRNMPMVLHGQPCCIDFLRLDPTGYVRWARLHGAVVLT